jgi:murein DD-endopeptidase MepM/ murein hydrolase activator NlpD
MSVHAPSKTDDKKPETALEADKTSKLQFTADETVSDTPEIHRDRKLNRAQRQADRTAGKLETAKSKLPSKKKIRSKKVFDDKTGKAKRKLYFESEVVSQAEHLKGSPPSRLVRAAARSALAFGHRKLYQVERENVGTEAAHKGEMAAEGVIRSALRHRKTAPYRKVAKLERKSVRKSVNLAYRKALAENPNSNMLSRAWQKRKIKKDYAKAARDAKKAAERAKRAGAAVSNTGKVLIGVAKRHPAATVVVVMLALLMFSFMSLVGAFGGIGSGGLGGMLTASYLADDAEIDNAELSYTEWETDLLVQIANAESVYGGYDEYRYSVEEICHNPYELMAYLTVKYMDFSFGEIESDLRALFEEQYALSFTPTTEMRYRSVTRTDPDTDESYEEQEAYDWRVMTVTLAARSFSDIALSRLSGDEYARYALLLQTTGNRQYLANPFGELGWLPYVSSYYGWRIHPISGAKDLHRGVDVAVAAGTEIRSGQDGTVMFADYSGDYGNVIVIEDDEGLVSKYAHCGSLLVGVGQSVKTGDVIATVGGAESHLHLEIMKNGIYVNPLFFADVGSLSFTPSYGYSGEPMGDGAYAALIAEAELHLGVPYVFGASGPDAFDCGGMICYVYRAAGVYDFGRIGAAAIYNACNPVSAEDARPGDVVTYHSTYSTPNPITHIGIFAGFINGRPVMLHSGSPLQYTYIDTPYWQEHFFGFARIPE